MVCIAWFHCQDRDRISLQTQAPAGALLQLQIKGVTIQQPIDQMPTHMRISGYNKGATGCLGRT